MEDFRHNYVNLTSLRLVRYDVPVVADAIKQMRNYEVHSRNQVLNSTKLIKVRHIRTLIKMQKIRPSLGVCTAYHHLLYQCCFIAISMCIIPSQSHGPVSGWSPVHGGMGDVDLSCIFQAISAQSRGKIPIISKLVVFLMQINI